LLNTIGCSVWLEFSTLRFIWHKTDIRWWHSRVLTEKQYKNKLNYSFSYKDNVFVCNYRFAKYLIDKDPTLNFLNKHLNYSCPNSILKMLAINRILEFFFKIFIFQNFSTKNKILVQGNTVQFRLFCLFDNGFWNGFLK